MPTTPPQDSTLYDCRETIRALLDENTALRKSGAAFGELAERLSQELRVARQRISVAQQNDPSNADDFDSRFLELGPMASFSRQRP